MISNDPSSDTTDLFQFERPSFSKVRNSVVLPDGTKREPMGSGVITGILGSGGMANVYEIWNPQLEINRAVKLLHPNYTEETKQRFQTEIKITAKLHHPNIIEIHAVGEWCNLPYIEMERIQGATLDKILHERGALPIEVCTSIAIMIGRALRYAHNQDYVIYGKNYHGVIHRDLKPSNVMLSKSGVVKLMDFGIARPTDASIHTTDGAILGTMQYLSPEQLEGREPDVRTDIYSLGTVLYEMLTGVKAFPDQNVSKLMIKKVKNQYKSLEHFNVNIPFRLRRLVHHCLIHDRNKRIRDATEFLSEISRIHKTITQLTPEGVLSQYVTAEPGEKKTISFKKRVPLGLVAALVAFSAGVYSAVVFAPGLITRHVNKSDAKSLVLSEPGIKKPDSTIHLVPLPAQKRQPELRKSRSAPVSLPAVTAIVDTVHKVVIDQVTLYERLKLEFGTSKKNEIFFRLIESGRYKDAHSLMQEMGQGDLNTDKSVIYTIRLYKELGLKKELAETVLTKDVSDGEYYLEKAKVLLSRGEIENAVKNLNICSQTPAAYLESKILRIEYLYYQAKCKSKKFDQNPSMESKNEALDSWFDVKSELQTSKDHRYFRDAESEMQRITEKMNSLKG